MMTCREAVEHLALYVGGDLDPRTGGEVRGHLESCHACSSEVHDYKDVISMVRDAMEPVEGLPLAVRSAVVRAASERVTRHPWWSRILPLPAHPAFAAVAPAVLVVLAIALPLALREPRESADSEGPVRIDMQADGGTVRLAWSDGRERPYRVYKSTDPRQLGRGPGQEVQGNQWVDSEPDSAPIVFYRVE